MKKIVQNKKTMAVAGLCLLSCLALGMATGFAVGKNESIQTSVAYGDDTLQEEMTVIAGRSITAEQKESIVQGFDTAAAAKNLTPTEGVKTAREIMLYRAYGNTYLVYNFAMDRYFAVSGSILNTYTDNEIFRRLGAPTTEEGTYQISGRSTAETITAGSYTAQIFETGVILKSGSEVKVYAGGVEEKNGGYVVHPVIDDQDIMRKDGNGFSYFGNVDGELHPLKDADFLATDNGYILYANYSSCCACIEYDTSYNIVNQYVYAAKNFVVNNGQYTATILPEVCISYEDMTFDGSSPVESDALAYYKKFQPDGTNTTLKTLFTDCYASLYQNGFVAGYR